MSRVPVSLVVRNYDFVQPLAAGDIETPGLDLTLIRVEEALTRLPAEPEIALGEHSFSRYMQRLATGDNSFVGIPAMLTRGFRHRGFFVRKDSGIREMKDLVGKRVGTNEWPATGNTWSRATIREAGVPIDRIDWYVGQVNAGSKPWRPDRLPAHAQAVPDRYLSDMLRAGEIDVIMAPSAPEGFEDPNGPFTRMFPNYREDEKAYYKRTGIYPVHHILVIRREMFEQHPEVAVQAYRAMEASKNMHQALRRRHHETTPWLLPELEETIALMGEDYHPYGFEKNRRVTEQLAEEQYAQGLIEQPLDPNSVFAEFHEAERNMPA